MRPLSPPVVVAPASFGPSEALPPQVSFVRSERLLIHKRVHVTAYVTDEELRSLPPWILDGVELLCLAHHEMHGRLMAVDAIAQPRSGEDLKALGPGRNYHLYPTFCAILSEGIGTEWANLMRGGPLFKHPGHTQIGSPC